MAGSFFILLDDVAALLDDIAAMSKVAMRKTAGVMGDDLALNAQQVTGVRPVRELPVVWAVAKGSLMNKVILIPIILLLSYFYPPLITLLLFIGGSYLCYEGVEAIIHKFFYKEEKKKNENEHLERVKSLSKTNLLRQEKAKIKKAIKTDFILSGEILVIALSALDAMGKTFMMKSIGLIAIGLLVTVLVYGIVALIVKADDFGLWLNEKESIIAQKIGNGILFSMPIVLKMLSVIGVVAMLLVGGSIVLHSLPFMHFAQDWVNSFSGFNKFVIGLGYEFIGGLIAGLVVIALVSVSMKIKFLLKPVEETKENL